MIPVLHVLDESCDENALQVLGVLLARLPQEAGGHGVCAVDSATAVKARRWLKRDVPHVGGGMLGWAPWDELVPRDKPDARPGVLHAWGAAAARKSANVYPGAARLVTLIDPVEAEDTARSIRAVSARVQVVAFSQVGRMRLLANGVVPEHLLVIRNPVDFGAIARAKKSDIRKQLVGEAAPVVLMSGPPTRAGGQYYGLWASAIIAQVHRNLRVIMPFESREARRLRRFVEQIRMSHLMVPLPEDATHGWDELVACADVLLAPAIEETGVEAIGWAMAAGIPVVGTAVRSVAELIADHSNGLLCKPGEARLLAARLLTALEDEGLRRTMTEVARGQAYEVFSVRAFVDNYTRLYENLAAGQPAVEGIRDMAVVG